jgi:S1-C subfamily serine protease
MRYHARFIVAVLTLAPVACIYKGQNGSFMDRYAPKTRRDMETSSTVALIIHQPRFGAGKDLKWPAKTLGEAMRLCDEEPEADQPSFHPVFTCTGVLVASDVVATAYHCLKNDPTKLVFVFGYDRNVTIGGAIDQRVYRYKRLVDGDPDADWALVQLDEDVEGHTPAKIRSSKKGYVQKHDFVFAVGHPDGIPHTVVRNGRITRVGDNDKYTRGPASVMRGHFVTNLDLFAGNSGSPIFSDTAAPEVVGLVLGGGVDYRETRWGCKVVRSCVPPKCTPNERAVSAELLLPALEDYL